VLYHYVANPYPKPMAPAKPFKDIKLTVPRHNTQRVSAKLGIELRKQGKAQGVLVDAAQPSSRLAQSIVCCVLTT